MELEQQIQELNQLVDPWAVKKSKHVKGPYTTGEYVEYQLRRIFGPQNWSFTILSGPETITISNSEAYAQAVGRLTVRFADGSEVTQDSSGVWPLRATAASNGGTLENTAAERYETVLKAACTDALKAAAERIGTCFRPMSDLDLEAHVNREAFRSSESGKRIAEIPAEESARHLHGDPEPEKPTKANGDARPAANPPATSTAFWGKANDMVAAGTLTKPQADEIFASCKTNDGVDWQAAIAKLEEHGGH